jgi:hypothetical protein
MIEFIVFIVRLQSLLPALTDLDRSATGTALTAAELAAISRHCTQLQRLRVSGTDEIQPTSATAAGRGSGTNTTRVIELLRRVSTALPKLKSLCIAPYEMEGATDESFNPNDIPAYAVLPLPASLEQLELEGDDSDMSDQWLLYGRIDWNKSLGALKHLKSIVRPPFNADSQDNVPACVVCTSQENESALLLCDSCPATYHTSCLRPALTSVPKGAWHCPLCAYAHRAFSATTVTAAAAAKK